ncbi:hypothetical protein ES703_117951 [subsurface metagenome]
MAQKVKADKYSNVAFAKVTMSAVNTLTFEAINMAVGVFQGVAMLIHRILYYPTDVSLREVVAATDTFSLALTTSNRLANIVDVSEPAIIDKLHVVGVGVNVEAVRLPLVSDLTMLPGGGRIVPANPLFVAMATAGAVAASKAFVQVDFTFIELTDQDYLELIQSQLPANIG